MKTWKSIVPVLSLALLACGDTQEASSGEEEKAGDLSFELVGTDSLGQQYRLRNANFYIYGYSFFDGSVASSGSSGSAGGGPWPGSSIVVSSETDPDAPAIVTRVVPGSYTITLDSNWHLEKLTASGPTPVAQSVLLSDATQYAYVYHNGVSNVVYRFGVDGQLIDFRHGDIVIGIDIERPGENPTGGGCGAGGSGGFSSGGFGGFSSGGSGGFGPCGSGGFGSGGFGSGGFGPSGFGGFGWGELRAHRRKRERAVVGKAVVKRPIEQAA